MKTTSKELSQRLADALSVAGYDFNPEQRWIGHPNIICEVSLTEYDYFNIPEIYRDHFEPGYNMPDWDELPARFTLSELMDMLPMTIREDDEYFEFTVMHINPGFWIHYQSGNGVDYDAEDHYGVTMINTIAKLVIWCIDNNHPINLPKTQSA